MDNAGFDWLHDIVLFIPNWKWLALTISLVTGFLLLSLFRHLTVYFKTHIAKHKNTHKALSHFLKGEIQYPSAWLLVCSFWYLSIYFLALPDKFSQSLLVVIHVFALIQILRLLYKAIDALGALLSEYAGTTESTLDDQIAPFATKSLKFIVIVLGVLLSLQSLGFNVAAMLAGLGIGSLALALAAQDTVANLFGSLTIILDRPFQIGDWIRVGDTEGVVEEVGFRSTRIRTFYKSVVTIPNSTMAKDKVDNLGERPNRRLRHTLGLSYNSPLSKIQQYMERLKYSLLQNPHIVSNETTIHLNALGDFDIKILLTCYIQVDDIQTEGRVQEEILFECLKCAQEVGVEFAYPTQNIHVASLPRHQ